MRKTVLLLAILVASIGTNAGAQEMAESKYGGLFPADIASQESDVPGLTVLEKRDYGIDLFIAGMIVGAAVPTIINVTGTLAALPDIANIGNPTSAILTGAVIVILSSALTSMIGFGMWIAGAAYWAQGNATLRSATVGTQAHGTDISIAFDGAGILLRY